jgi:hypothetical protein
MYQTARSQRKRKWKCKSCERRFGKKARLAKHERKIHPTGDVFKCEFCERKFSTKRACCDQQFFKEINFLEHVRMHTVERRFKCKYCERSFHYNALLVTHEGFHTGEKPYKCETCGLQFTQKKQLLHHARKHAAKTTKREMQLQHLAQMREKRSAEVVE